VRRASDAYEALACLRALPYVDGKRIGVMGGSHGGPLGQAADQNQRPSRTVMPAINCQSGEARDKPAATATSRTNARLTL